jgi:hypothetical protein
VDIDVPVEGEVGIPVEGESVTAEDSGSALSEPPADESASPGAEVEVSGEAAAATAQEASPNPAVETKSGTPAWLAALLGLVFGAGTALLVLRERLLEMLRGAPARVALPAGSTRLETSAAGARKRSSGPLPIKMPPAREPSMVVEEKSSFDTGELPIAKGWTGAASLGNAESSHEPTVIAKPPRPASQRKTDVAFDGNTEVPDTETLEAMRVAELDFDLSNAAPTNTEIDQDIGQATGSELSPTATDWPDQFGPPDEIVDSSLTMERPPGWVHESAGDETLEQLDLNTMIQRAEDDTHLAETLRDALELLESDYEDELTGNLMVDRAKLEDRLGGDEEEDTLARTGTDRNPRPRR